jgi:response regulator RpfG family c-di-GMP phosphodiesterase
MNGINIIDYLHEKFPKAKKYLLTGESENKLEYVIKNSAINGFLPKPWEFEDLKNYVLSSLED